MSAMLELIEKSDAPAIQKILAEKADGSVIVYAQSLMVDDKTGYAAVKINGVRNVLAAGPNADKLTGTEGDGYCLCPWNADTATALRGLLPFTAPRACGKDVSSFGTGDRLGVAGPAHVRCVKDVDVFPVLAQQSMRELTQCERTYREVVDCACWAVFQEGYTGGFGADGDHLKKMEDIKMAVETGMRMITLDLSDKLRGDAFEMEKEDVEDIFLDDFDEDEREALLSYYENQEFFIDVNGEKRKIKFIYKDVIRNVVCYYRGVEFAAEVYHYLQDAVPESIDFEISIDEVGFPTKPKSHFFVACELEKRMIEPASLAPCFVGEFQKAIDYIGDKDEFKAQLEMHFGIAQKFGGYKLSIHSGSDKFSVYPIIGEVTGGKYHVKTAGTSWVEAVKMIALRCPELYREVHAFALESFEAATELYHVTTDLNNVPALDTFKDDELVSLFENNDARQLIHITYGFILRAKDDSGAYRFRDRLYQAWDDEEDSHYELLEGHIGKHIELLENR